MGGLSSPDHTRCILHAFEKLSDPERDSTHLSFSEEIVGL